MVQIDRAATALPPEFTLISQRADGSFVVSLRGRPYHVTADDALWEIVRSDAARVGLPIETPPLLAPPDPIAIINAHVEAVARSMGYSSAASCAGYASSTVLQWATEAQDFIAWRDAVWLTAFARKDDPPPATAEAVLALLPAWVPPSA